MADEHTSFWSHIRRRIVVTSTMERDVRLAFIVGTSIIPITIAFSLIHWDLGLRIHTLIGEIPLLTFLVFVLGEALVLSFLFAGIMRLKGRLRYGVLAGLCLMFLATLLVNETLAAGIWLMLPILALLPISAIAEHWTWSAQRVGQVSAALAVGEVVLAGAYIIAGQQSIVIILATTQAELAMLGLFMASTDIAEIITFAAELSSERVGNLLTPKIWATLVALGAVALNITTSTLITGNSAKLIAQALGTGLGVALWLGIPYWMIVGLGRKLGPVAPEIGYRSLLLIVSTFFIAFQSGAMWRLLRDPTGYDAGKVFGYVEVGLLGIVALLVCVALFVIVGRRSEKLYQLFSYGIYVGVCWFMYHASGGMDIAFIADAAAMGSIAFLLIGAMFRSVRHHLRAVCRLIVALNLSFACYTCILWLFVPKPGAEGGFGVGQAVVVLLALAWDIASSGGAITNRHTQTFPRFSRVCFFLAYVVSVALFVVVSESSHLINPITGAEAHRVFESEQLVALGMALFGAPFFLFIFGLQMRAALKSGSAEAQTSPEPQAA